MLTAFAVEYAYYKAQYKAIQKYFFCEAAGSETECDRSSFDDLSIHGLVLAGYFLQGLLPVINLSFVINWTLAKAFFKQLRLTYYLKVTSKQTSTTNKREGNQTMESVTQSL